MKKTLQSWHSPVRSLVINGTKYVKNNWEFSSFPNTTEFIHHPLREVCVAWSCTSFHLENVTLRKIWHCTISTSCHCTMCTLYSISQLNKPIFKVPLVWHHSTYINTRLFSCEINVEKSILVSFRLLILWFALFYTPV